MPLKEIRKLVQDENDGSDYEGLTKEEEAALLDRLKEKREVKFQGARRSNEGAAADCRQVINSINREVRTPIIFICLSSLLDPIDQRFSSQNRCTFRGFHVA